MEFDKLIKSGKRRPLFNPAETTQTIELGREALERMLPHRDPFLLLDRIVQMDFEQKAVEGRRVLDPEDPVFRGHFPGDPTYPGVLILEMIGQLGICLQHLLHLKSTTVGPEQKPLSVRLLKVHHALFQRALSPGDEARLIARSVEEGDYVAICSGQALVGDQVAAFAIFEVFFADEAQ